MIRRMALPPPHPRVELNCVCQIRPGKSFLNITDSVTDTKDASFGLLLQST